MIKLVLFMKLNALKIENTFLTLMEFCCFRSKYKVQ